MLMTTIIGTVIGTIIGSVIGNILVQPRVQLGVCQDGFISKDLGDVVCHNSSCKGACGEIRREGFVHVQDIHKTIHIDARCVLDDRAGEKPVVGN